jgi:hypothetical protein
MVVEIRQGSGYRTRTRQARSTKYEGVREPYKEVCRLPNLLSRGKIERVFHEKMPKVCRRITGAIYMLGEVEEALFAGGTKVGASRAASWAARRKQALGHRAGGAIV